MAMPSRCHLLKGICWPRDFKKYSFPGASPNPIVNDEALVLPYLDYCSEVWGCTGKSQCDRLQKL